MFNTLVIINLLLTFYISNVLHKIRVSINNTSGASTEGVAEEPLLPAEKKLIIWSLILAIILIAFLIWVAYTFFLGQH